MAEAVRGVGRDGEVVFVSSFFPSCLKSDGLVPTNLGVTPTQSSAPALQRKYERRAFRRSSKFEGGKKKSRAMKTTNRQTLRRFRARPLRQPVVPGRT